jgi:hypothetical protein
VARRARAESGRVKETSFELNANSSQCDTSVGERPEESSSSNAAPTPLATVLTFAVGVLCVVGGWSSLAGGKWPIYMPPQLDVIALPLSWASERLGAYVGGAIALAVGAACVIGAAFAVRSEKP